MENLHGIDACVCAVCTRCRILKSNEVEIMGLFDARLCVIMSFWNQRHYSNHRNPLSNLDWLNSLGTKLVFLIRIDYISKYSLEIFSNIRFGIHTRYIYKIRPINTCCYLIFQPNNLINLLAILIHYACNFTKHCLIKSH